MLNPSELSSKLTGYNFFIVIDDFFGTTFSKSPPKDFGYLGIAYKIEGDEIKARLWKRNSSHQYQISSEFEEHPFKLHEKLESQVLSMNPDFFNFLETKLTKKMQLTSWQKKHLC